MEPEIRFLLHVPHRRCNGATEIAGLDNDGRLTDWRIWLVVDFIGKEANRIKKQSFNSQYSENLINDTVQRLHKEIFTVLHNGCMPR